MEAVSRCGSERDAHRRRRGRRAEAGPASSRSRSNVWMGCFQRRQSWCSGRTGRDATLEAVTWDLSVHGSPCICPYMSSSAGACGRLRRHASSRSPLYQAQHVRPGEMGQRQACHSFSPSFQLLARVIFFSQPLWFPVGSQNKNETPLVVCSSCGCLDVG